MGLRQWTPDHHMWATDVVELSVDGWQPNEDAVMMQYLETGVQCNAKYCAAVIMIKRLR